MKTSNKNARSQVNELKDFKGSNTFGENTEKFYTVYSYGYHFPLFSYDKVKGVWYTNSDRYSVTTSKHRTQLHPFYPEAFVNKTTKEIKDLISK